MARTRRSRFKLKRNQGTLPGRPKTGRPPGVPISTKKNPSGFGDTAIVAGAGFGGFAVSRMTSRITTSALASRFPRLAPHAGVIAAAALFAAAWAWAHKIKWWRVGDYAVPLTIGAGVGAAASVVQTYIPKYGWLLGLDIAVPEAHQLPASQPQQPLPQGDSGADDNWYQYQDFTSDAGRYSAPESAIPEEQIPTEPNDNSTESIDDLMSQLDQEESAAFDGFGGN